MVSGSTTLPGGRTRAAASERPRRRLGPPGVVLGLAAAVLLAVVGYPMVWLLLGAFGVPAGLSFDHVVRAVTRPANVTALGNTLVLAGGAGALSVVLGVPLAWAAARTDVPGRRLIHGLVTLTYVTPPYLTAMAAIILLGPNAGHVNRFLVWLLPIERGPFDVFSMAGLMAVIGFHVFAFPYFLTYSALRAIDAPLEESARMLGASGWTVLRRVTLPVVAPAISGGALLAAVDAMSLFGPQALLGSPAQLVFLPTRIYGALRGYPPRFEDAAALSLALVILTGIGLAVQRGYLERRSHVTVGGRGVRCERVRLGGWRWPLLGFCLVVLAASAVAPLSVLVAAAFSHDWTLAPTVGNLTLANFAAALFDDQVVGRAIGNSFRLAGAAALITVVLALFLTYIERRTTLRGRQLLDYLALLPLGLPGTVMAVGLLLAFIRPPLVLYGTVWILLVAYVARFIPLAVRSTNAALSQIAPSLEEAARIAGASWWQSIRLVLVPLLRPGMVTAWMLVFIPALGELSATILLYGSGTETISVAIYRLNDLGQLELVAALSVVMIGVILLASLALQAVAGRNAAFATEAPPA